MHLGVIGSCLCLGHEQRLVQGVLANAAGPLALTNDHRKSLSVCSDDPVPKPPGLNRMMLKVGSDRKGRVRVTVSIVPERRIINN